METIYNMIVSKLRFVLFLEEPVRVVKYQAAIFLQGPLQFTCTFMCTYIMLFVFMVGVRNFTASDVHKKPHLVSFHIFYFFKEIFFVEVDLMRCWRILLHLVLLLTCSLLVFAFLLNFTFLLLLLELVYFSLSFREAYVKGFLKVSIYF